MANRKPGAELVTTPIFVSLSFAMLLATCVWLIWPALSGPFLFDDFPNLRHLGSLGGAKMDWISLANYMAQYGTSPGRPLSMLSFVINDFAWPSDPWGFKYTNLMLHLLVGVVIFGFARSIARLTIDATRADLIALLVFGAWLIHPMQLSTSMLVVQRMTQLSALFTLGGLWAYIALAERAKTTLQAFLAVVALGIFTLFAVLCKETGALAPLLAVVINTTVLREKALTQSTWTRRTLLAGTVFPVLVLVGKIAFDWSALTYYGLRDFSMEERLLTQGRVLVHYLYEILLPNLRGNGIYHDDFGVSRGWLHPWTTLPAAVFVIGLILAALYTHRRAPVFAFAVLFFFGGHLLESSVFPLEMYFEHRNYLPMIGPLFLGCYLVARATGGWKRSAGIAAVLWIAFAGFLTWVQAPIWGSAKKMTAVWLIEQPMSPRVLQQRAQYLFDTHRPRAAALLLLDGYERGVRGEDFPLQSFNVACNTHSSAIAVKSLPLALGALKDGPYNRAVLQTVVKLRRNALAGTCPDTLTSDQFMNFTEILLANPNYARGDLQSFIHVERARIFEEKRDLNSTMRELEAAWRFSPTPKLGRFIAVTLASAGLYEDASEWSDRASQISKGGMLRWLTNDDVRSRRLQEALRNVTRRRTENNDNPVGSARPDENPQ